MPGFKINGEGDGPSATAEIRRTHRWYFASLGPDQKLSREVRLVLKEASRPSYQLEEAIMHHNQEEAYFGGKTKWEPLSLNWYDVEQDPDVSQAMFEWVEICNKLTGGAAGDVTPPSTYKANQSDLQMRDGVGDPNETWEIYNGWPQMVNWGSLDYSSSELQMIEVKFRFDRAKRVD